MLVITRRKNESVVINNDMTISVVDIRGDKVRLGINVPKEVPVHRQGVFDAIRGRASFSPPQFSSDEAGFLQAILDSPDDDGIRLIYADWLEERGDPRGEFIRLQCHLARLATNDQSWAELANKEAALLAHHEPSWRQALPPILRYEPFVLPAKTCGHLVAY